MLFIPENRDDIHRYYRNTYVKFKETGEMLFYIRNVDHDKVTGYNQEKQEFELYMKDDVPYEVDYILPRKSFFQHGKRACILQRVPAKQYQRGISEQNTDIKGITLGGGTTSIPVDFTSLKSFVSKQAFPDLLTAIKNVNKDNSIALSPRFAYVPTGRFIFSDLQCVATVENKTNTITMLHPIFKPEVEKVVHGLNFKVV